MMLYKELQLNLNVIKQDNLRLAGGSFDFVCKCSGNNRRGVHRVYANSSDCSGGDYSESDAPKYVCNDTKFSVVCDTLIFKGLYHPGSEDCGSSATQSITLIMRAGHFCVDNTTFISLILSRGYLLAEYNHNGCTGCIVDSDDFYDVGCDMVDTNISDAWTVHDNILTTIPATTPTTTEEAVEGYSTSNSAVDADGYFFTPGVYRGGQCGSFDPEFATGSFESICVGGVNDRRGIWRAYENSSDCSGSNYTEVDVDVCNCNDFGFSVACDTLIYDEVYHSGSEDYSDFFFG